MNIVDLLAILPYYLNFVLEGFKVGRTENTVSSCLISLMFPVGRILSSLEEQGNCCA